LAARARPCAARTRLFGLLPRQTARCAPPLPAHRSFAASYLTPKNILNLSNLGPPRQGPFSFHRNTEAMKYEVHLPPASPITALLILPSIFWGQNYVPVSPYAIIFFGFSFLYFSDLFFLLFSSLSSLLFTFFLFFSSYLFLFFSSYLFLFFSSYPFLPFSSYSSRRCYSSSSFSSPLIF
jgi:hypothetical protein